MFLDTNRRYELRDIEPQMNAPSRASGGRTHVLRSNTWILHSGGHGADERRFVNRVSTSFIQAHPRFISSLCALCVLCGARFNLTAKSAKNAKGGLSDG